MPSRTGPPSVGGRWALAVDREADPTRRAHARAEAFLERHGVLTRGALGTERGSGGFAGVYKVLRAMEDSGRVRRGYIVEGLGAAQFAVPGAIDRVRALSNPDSGGVSGLGPSVSEGRAGAVGDAQGLPAIGARDPGGGSRDPGGGFGGAGGGSDEDAGFEDLGDEAGPGRTPGVRPDPLARARADRQTGARPREERERLSRVVLAAADPAQPYGAALPWPATVGEAKQRPARKAGALVVLVDGAPALYVERGGRSLLSFTTAREELAAAAQALAGAVHEGWLGSLAVEKADGDAALGSELAEVLTEAGFRVTPKGLRLRA
jgi:ATP-dependent Lhr-like helicase